MLQLNAGHKREILAGITTFLTMAYIAFVNPLILHDAGMDQGAVFSATCLITAFACAGSGFFANTPIGMAPGMALNIYFSYSVVQGLGIDWQHALAMVFVSGLLFLMVSLTPVRRLLTDAIPYHLQIAILIGISLLIALIALQSNDIIVRGEHSLMILGSLSRPQSMLFFLGFIVILTLDYYKVAGAIIIGILFISGLSLLFGFTKWHGIFSLPPSITPTFLQVDFSGFFSLASIKATFAFFLIAVFDATGTLMGLLSLSFFKNQPSYSQKLKRSLIVDAAASAMAGLLGTASTSPFIESAAGIEVGGRTGLTALVVAMGFIFMLFFYPLAEAIPSFATGPALLYVACCMLKNMRELKLDEMSDAAPCVLIIMMIPFTSSIADGIGAGIILHSVLKLLARQRINPLLWILSVVFLVFFIIS